MTVILLIACYRFYKLFVLLLVRVMNELKKTVKCRDGGLLIIGERVKRHYHFIAVID